MLPSTQPTLLENHGPQQDRRKADPLRLTWPQRLRHSAAMERTRLENTTTDNLRISGPTATSNVPVVSSLLEW
jgi:hypothetical protein